MFTLDIKEFEFKKEAIHLLKDNLFVKSLWPVLYILTDDKRVYVGETTNAFNRMNQHLESPNKKGLKNIHLITSNIFNKSATLDIESKLISYMIADSKYKVINANAGVANHNYYQKYDLYKEVFDEIWNKLKVLKIVLKDKKTIENDNVFKYSPYKALSIEQKANILDILNAILKKNYSNIVINGGAGTGKSILAIYIMKLLKSDFSDIDESDYDSYDKKFINLTRKIQKEEPNIKLGLVIPMSSFRTTLKKVFKSIEGLSQEMVISPNDVSKQKYDLLIVDEAHRLKKRKNLTNYKAFDDACALLGLDKETTNELEWVKMQSQTLVLFYDKNQSIKPSDIDKNKFDFLFQSKKTKSLELKTQFRVKGGEDYISFVHDLLNCRLKKNSKVNFQEYDIKLFENISELISSIKEKEEEFGLSRLIAGFSWEWVSKKNPSLYDIDINGVKLKWNSTAVDWINDENKKFEVGCIHTTQGYDLNYAGIIFGNEISYDKKLNKIIIKKENYFDRNGKNSISDPEKLKEYIINIYSTMMFRGIKGTYIYACDKDLNEYLSAYIKKYYKSNTESYLPNTPKIYPNFKEINNQMILADSNKKKE